MCKRRRRRYRAGFSQLYTIANYTNQLLLYQIQQNDTMVCYLEKIARQTCALFNEAALQTAAQQAMREDLDDLRNSTSWRTPPPRSNRLASRL